MVFNFFVHFASFGGDEGSRTPVQYAYLFTSYSNALAFDTFGATFGATLLLSVSKE
jgi:hypothetical protein